MALHHRLRRILSKSDSVDTIQVIANERSVTRRKAADIYEQMKKLYMSNEDLTDIIQIKLGKSQISEDISSNMRSRKAQRSGADTNRIRNRLSGDKDERISLGSTGNRSRINTSDDSSVHKDNFDLDNSFEVFIDYDPVSKAYQEKPHSRGMSSKKHHGNHSSKLLSRQYDAPIPQSQNIYPEDTGYRSDFSTLDRLAHKTDDTVTTSDIEDMCRNNAGLIESDTDTLTGSPEASDKKRFFPVNNLSPTEQKPLRVSEFHIKPHCNISSTSDIDNINAKSSVKKSVERSSPDKSPKANRRSSSILAKVHRFEQIQKGNLPACPASSDSEYDNDTLKAKSCHNPYNTADICNITQKSNVEYVPLKERSDAADKGLSTKCENTKYASSDKPSTFRGPRLSHFRDVRDVGPLPPQERTQKFRIGRNNKDEQVNLSCRSTRIAGDHKKESHETIEAERNLRHTMSPVRDTDSKVQSPTWSGLPSQSRSSKHSDSSFTASTIESVVKKSETLQSQTSPPPRNNPSREMYSTGTTSDASYQSSLNFAEESKQPLSPPLPPRYTYDTMSSDVTVQSSLICAEDARQPFSPPLPPRSSDFALMSSDAEVDQHPRKERKPRKTLSYRNRSKSDTKIQPNQSRPKQQNSRPQLYPQYVQNNSNEEDGGFEREMDKFNNVLRDVSRSMYKGHKKALPHNHRQPLNSQKPYISNEDQVYKQELQRPLQPYPQMASPYQIDERYYAHYTPYYPPYPVHYTHLPPPPPPPLPPPPPPLGPPPLPSSEWDYRDSYYPSTPYFRPYPASQSDWNPYYDSRYAQYENPPRRFSPFEQRYSPYHHEYHTSYDDPRKRSSYPGYNYFDKCYQRLSPSVPHSSYSRPESVYQYNYPHGPPYPPIPPHSEGETFSGRRSPYSYRLPLSRVSPDVPPPALPHPIPPMPHLYGGHYPLQSAFRAPPERQDPILVDSFQQLRQAEFPPPPDRCIQPNADWEYGQPIDESLHRQDTGFELWDVSSGQPSIESTTSSFDQYVPGPRPPPTDTETDTDTGTLIAVQERESLIMSPFTELQMVPRRSKRIHEKPENRWSGSYDNSTINSTLRSNASTMTITDDQGTRIRASRYDPYQPAFINADEREFVRQPELHQDVNRFPISCKTNSVSSEAVELSCSNLTQAPPAWKMLSSAKPYLKPEFTHDPNRNSTPPPPKITDSETSRDILEENGVIFVKPQYPNGESPLCQPLKHDIPKINIVSQSPSPQQSPRGLDSSAITQKVSHLPIPDLSSPIHSPRSISSLTTRSMSPRSEHDDEDCMADFDEDKYEEEPVVNLDMIKAALFGERGEQPDEKSDKKASLSEIKSPDINSLYSLRYPLPSAGSYIYDEQNDQYVTNACKENALKKKTEIQDALTEFEGLYETLQLEDENLFDRADRQEVKNNIKSSQKCGSLSRLSIDNVQKFHTKDNLNDKDKRDPPSMEYTRQWLSEENERIMANAPRINEDLLNASRGSDEVFDTSPQDRQSVVNRTFDDADTRSMHSSLHSSSNVKRAPFPRRFTDDMSRRRMRTVSVPASGSGPHQASISWLEKSPALTPATSIDCISRRANVRPRSPDAVFDDVNFRNIRRSMSTSGLDDIESNPSLLPSPTTADYLNKRTTPPRRARMRIRPDPEPDKYHDDMAYRRLRKDVEPVVISFKKRSKSLDRINSETEIKQQSRPTYRRRGSVGKIAEMFEQQADTGSPTSPVQLHHSHSLPDLTNSCVQYDSRGDIVSNDPKLKASVKRTNKQTALTPRLVKQRSKFRQRSFGNESTTDDSETPDSDPNRHESGKSDSVLFHRKRLCDMDSSSLVPSKPKTGELSDYDNLQNSDSSGCNGLQNIELERPPDPSVFNTRKQSKDNIMNYYDSHPECFANVVAYFEASGKHGIVSNLPTKSITLRKAASYDDITIDSEDHDINVRIRRKSGSPSSADESPRLKSLRMRCGSDPLLTEGRTVKPPPHRENSPACSDE